MIVIKEEVWNEVPVLLVEQAGAEDKALPVFTYFHGFTSAREHNLPIAYMLAAKGYRVLLPEALHHGIREDDVSSSKRQLEFFGIVKENLHDLQQIHQYASDKGLIQDDRFAIGGTSMGGITTCAALTQFDWIKAGMVMMGSPKIAAFARGMVEAVKQSGMEMNVSEEELEQLYASLEKIDLSLHPETIGNRPLFFWHGDKDPVVPYAHSRSFYETLENKAGNAKQFTYVTEEGSGHKVSRKAMLAGTAWLEKVL
ncbi:prolyl oligopeptidase family serine peptidase [Terribacillus sp. 7520-G]|uniref:prolyl oligopeptidase family serine peptidase n=1 Tax=Terribacillus TaxID=459532 RepID=UPI000BA53B7A|nr:prolyl oligopeptidase family serine peptidase [Terribacillus sp. 7520-G]PAD38251.1 esterase [Terribacillus sp. 7520-G]